MDKKYECPSGIAKSLNENIQKIRVKGYITMGNIYDLEAVYCMHQGERL